MECYIDYLDSKNRFRETRKEFKSFAAADTWGKANLPNYCIDMVKYF